MTLQADFETDLRSALHGALAALGYTVDANANAHQTAITYFNVMRRRIEPGRRIVHWSRELQRKKARLPREHRRALHRISSLCGEGRDLNPFLSTTLNDPDYPDHFMSDWGMHHMHLDLPSGKPAKDPRFVRRTGDLLIALVAADAIRFVDVVPHGRWELQDLVEILHGNWPKAIEHARLPGVRAGSVITSATRKTMRSKFILPTVMKDGTVYGPIGGGASSAGTNSQAVQKANDALNLLWSLQLTCTKNPLLVRKAIRDRVGKRLDNIHLRLTVVFSERGDLQLDVEETSTGATLCEEFERYARKQGLSIHDWLWARRTA